VTAFGMKLRKSPHAGYASRQEIVSWAESGTGSDPFGMRKEFAELVKKSRRL